MTKRRYRTGDKSLKLFHQDVEKETIETANVLVTGAMGFIGVNLFEKLLHTAYRPFGISKNGGVINNIAIDPVDLLDQAALNRYYEEKSFDGVIHLAAVIPSSFYDEKARHSLIENVAMTINLLEVLPKQNSPIFIYASSSSIYGYPDKLPVLEETPAKPDNFYSLGKLFGELLCQQYQRKYHLPVAILRISAPYGPGMRGETVVKKFIKKALLSEDITLYGTGSRSQDFVYVEDVVDAIVRAYQTRATGIFNISSGVSISMKKLAETVLQVLPNSTSKIVYAGVDDPQENYRAAFSCEKARKSFNYKPKYSLENSIRKYAIAVKQELGL